VGDSGVEPSGAVPVGRSERTRRVVVDATVARLRSEGAFTVEQVAADVGVSVATIYNRFPEGRDGLLAAAFDTALDRLVSAGAVLTVEHLLDHGLQATIRAMVDGLVAVFTDEALVMRSALARLPESRVLRESYRRHEADARSRNHRFVQLGQAAGRIADEDTAELADVLVVMGQGLNNPVLLGSSHRARLVDHLTAAIVAVLEPGGPTR
jgi:AcrR family transcriptional regulator